jgi:hypothetical protein
MILYPHPLHERSSKRRQGTEGFAVLPGRWVVEKERKWIYQTVP